MNNISIFQADKYRAVFASLCALAYHGLPQKYLQSYLDEFCYRFSRRNFGATLFDRLAIAMVDFPKAELNG